MWWLAIWISASALTPSHPSETVRIDRLIIITETPPPRPSTPVVTGRCTDVPRYRVPRPKSRYVVRLRRYRGQVATFPDVEIDAERWRSLRVDDVVELRSLVREPEGWWR